MLTRKERASGETSPPSLMHPRVLKLRVQQRLEVVKALPLGQDLPAIETKLLERQKERIMKDESKNVGEPVAEGLDTSALPAVVDRATWQAELDKLRVREKAHTHEGDAIAAARRRLPMVEVDATLPLIGPHGPVTLLEVFEGRRLLIAYYHMWYPGQPAAEQCEGCTFFNGQVRELSYLHSRDVTYATFCQGPYDESIRYRDFMGWDVPWYAVQDAASALLAGRPFNWFYLVCYLRHEDRVFETYWTNGRGVEVMAPSYGLLDRTVYGRQETWEDSPAGWPQRWDITAEPAGGQLRTNGRPTAQWSRLAAVRSDDLGTAGAERISAWPGAEAVAREHCGRAEPFRVAAPSRAWLAFCQHTWEESRPWTRPDDGKALANHAQRDVCPSLSLFTRTVYERSTYESFVSR